MLFPNPFRKKMIMAGKPLLENVHIVLVEPKTPGNIGSTVRAMKNMGLGRLRLVNPVDYRDHEEQRKLGYRSQEIIAASEEYPTLSAAVADMAMVFLATSKKGKWKKDFLLPVDAAIRIVEGGATQKVAIVFGREDKGVTIDECQLANYFIRIPSAVTYPSLNLSQAVMVIAYEVYKEALAHRNAPPLPPVANRQSFERLTENIWSLMLAMEVREPTTGLFHRSLKRALNRTQWTDADVAVFDRFCKQTRWYVENRCHKKNPGEE
jgi:tRNA/rRNA methyltransferase